MILRCVQEFLDWLVTAAAGPAFFGLPVTWTASVLARVAKRWFERLRRTDGLSRVVMAATEAVTPLSDAEFSAIRGLLEKEETWETTGRGTVEDLAVLISARLPARPETEALAVGRAIAAGVLEFAVHDLEPELFEEAMLARLDRLEANHASRLDRELFRVHADLAAQLAAWETADEDRFSDLAGRLSRALDRLPPGPAGPGEVAVYLARLAWWLDADPWPQDVRFAGPVLVPSEIERKLRITGAHGEEDQDADELSGQCSRLVICGAPGAGKTWLAKRAARRCALAALVKLADGASLGEVELPVFTTCARLMAMPSGDGIRDAIVRSALGQLADLGGSRVTAAVQALLVGRNAPTLVVLDSLDEAPAPDDRIRQADTLPQNWRVILTSRPSSWNRQLATGTMQHDPSRQIGTLLPLEYPGDVDAFIARWFAAQAERGADLAAQIRDRPQLQEAATVPLILAFYCIIGGRQPLPDSSTDLHAKVIKRMLTGCWRGSGDLPSDRDGCLETLRSWAWSAAASDPVSGLGAWADEFATAPVQNPGDRAALDHVAPPLGPPDPDTGMIARRFAHRSIQEHMVAEYVATLPAKDAAEALIGHLWYDEDWQQYAAHRALALHPRRDEVLRDLVRRVTGSDEFPGKILDFDGCWEIRMLLACLAIETTETDWSREAAALIVRARTDLAKAQRGLSLIPAEGWPASNDLLVHVLLRKLEAQRSWIGIGALVDALTEMNLSAADSTRMRAAVLGALAWTHGRDTFLVARLVTRLAPSAAERAEARDRMIRALDSCSSYSGSGEWEASVLADLTETGEEQARVVEELIKSAGRCDRRIAVIADVIDRLGPTAEQRRSACAILLERLASRGERPGVSDLGWAIVRLRPTSEERARTLDSMMHRIISADHLYPLEEIGAAISELAATPQDHRRVHGVLIEKIAQNAASGNIGKVCLLTRLVAELELTEDERARVKHSLLSAMVAETKAESIRDLALAGMDLDPGDRELFRTRGLEAVLAQCVRWETGQPGRWRLFESLPELAVTADERARALDAALGVLTRGGDDYASILSVREVLGLLADSAADRDRVRTALLAKLDSATHSDAITRLAELLSSLVQEKEDRERIRTALLGKLSSITSRYEFGQVAAVVGEMSETDHEKAEARRLMLKIVNEEGMFSNADMMLTGKIVDLRPVVADLDSLGDPPYGFNNAVLAAIRENSPLATWLGALPKLCEPRMCAGAAGPAPRGVPKTTPSATVASGIRCKSAGAGSEFMDEVTWSL